jgi:transcriptional regulator with XRE-family HTH domain
MDRMRRDDALIANALRELRRRSGMTQEVASAAAGVSPRVFRRVERIGAEGSSISTLRAVFEPFDARVNVMVWWHGAELDRLLDARHAAVIERVVAVFRRRKWLTATEVTFSEYG